MDFKNRKRIIDLAIKYGGDYSKLKVAVSMGEEVSLVQEKNQTIYSSTIVIGDECYPEYFLHLKEPPFVLFCYGNKHLLKIPNRFGVVGSRKPTTLGLRVINGPLEYALYHYKQSEESIVLINGMARGVDLISARMAIKYGLPIIMYLGSGIDKVYPSEAMDIYDYCKKGNGLVISEYPGSILPKPEHFPFRNRLIAASSTLLFVPEASIPSGTYSTINYGLNLGVSIATCPFPFNVENNLNNELIRDGAELITNGKELVEFIKYNKFNYSA